MNFSSSTNLSLLALSFFVCLMAACIESPDNLPGFQSNTRDATENSGNLTNNNVENNSSAANNSQSNESNHSNEPNDLCDATSTEIQEGSHQNGTAQFPYLICSAAQLNDIGAKVLDQETTAKYRASNYRLVRDIDLSDVPQFNMIGTSLRPFKGRFDGNGYTISNIILSYPEVDSVGFFGYLDGAVIENVRLVDIKVVGNRMVGALIGGALNGRIYNSHVIADSDLIGVDAEDIWYDVNEVDADILGISIVGGLVGFMDEGSITRSSFRGMAGVQTIHYTERLNGDFVGGLIGSARSNDFYHTILDESYADAIVFGDNNVGGLIGLVVNSEVSNSYARGVVWGNTHIGGLVGSLGDHVRVGKVTHSYADNLIFYGDQNASNIGPVIGLLGEDESQNLHSLVHNTYHSVFTACSDCNDFGIELNDTEMMDASSYVGFDFDTIWRMSTCNEPRPYLQWDRETCGR